MFAYCRNNPVCRIDITGYADEEVDLDGDTKDELFHQPLGGVTSSEPTVGRSAGNAGNNITGYGQAPHQGAPGSTYTQISSDGKGNVVSQTTYNEYRQRGQRIDWAGRDHGVGLPHIHIFSYGYYNGELKRTNEYIERYFEDSY